MTDVMIERVAKAWTGEWKRWTKRTNTDGEEACRFDDSDFAGSFTEIHNVGRGEKATEAFRRLREAASARAAIAAMRQPTEEMVAAFFDAENRLPEGSGLGPYTALGALIDGALK